MTPSKASLGAALGRGVPSRSGLHCLEVQVAARFTERLLPAKCDGCDQGMVDDSLGEVRHKSCHGTGELWDEGLVEVIAAVICENDFGHDSHPSEFLDTARAVLSALTAEVGKPEKLAMTDFAPPAPEGSHWHDYKTADGRCKYCALTYDEVKARTK